MSASLTNGQLAILDSLTAQGYPEEVIEAQQRLYEALNSTLTIEEEADILELMEQHEEDMRPLTHPETAEKKGCGTKRSRGAPKGPRKAPAPECRCMARIYGTGHEQCSNRRHKEHGDYCKTHGKQAGETEVPLQFKDVTAEEASKMTTAQLQTGLFHGRIDQPIPTHNAEGERCVFWKGEDETEKPNWENPATFLGSETGGWHAFSSEGKKAISLNKRWKAKQAKDAAKDAKKLEREEAKAAKAAEKAAKAAEPSSPKQKKTNAYFLWLNSEGVRDAITKHLATQSGRTTVVKSAEVTKMAGAIWGCMDPSTKQGWWAKAAWADQEA